MIRAKAEEIVEVASKLIDENKLLSASLLIKEGFKLIGEKDRAIELEEIVYSRKYFDKTLLGNYLDELRTALKSVKKQSSKTLEGLHFENLLLAITIVLLVLVISSILPPQGDLIAIPTATLLFLFSIDRIIKRVKK